MSGELGPETWLVNAYSKNFKFQYLFYFMYFKFNLVLFYYFILFYFILFYFNRLSS